MTTIVTIRQIDGVRAVAVSETDARTVRRDRTMIDAVTVLGVVDWYRDGTVDWARTGPTVREMSPTVREMLRAWLR